jgi:hypothetical protein
MIVSGTPEELKVLPSVTPDGTRRVSVRTNHVAQALPWLRQQPYCSGATIFGETVRAVIQADVTDTFLTASLHEQNFDADVREAEPSLEDVFVALTERSEKEATAKLHGKSEAS